MISESKALGFGQLGSRGMTLATSSVHRELHQAMRGVTSAPTPSHRADTWTPGQKIIMEIYTVGRDDGGVMSSFAERVPRCQLHFQKSYKKTLKPHPASEC